MGMGWKSKRKKTTAADLPEELIRREILTRLPAKYVVRFKSISKSWLSLFSEPRFIKQHFTYSATQTSNDYDCLVATRNNKVIILSRDKETLALESPYHFDVLGSVRGIVCLTSCHHMLLLWNPATHQSKEISVSTRYADRRYGIGFGYDPVSDNYKLVILSEDLKSATVYDSNSDNWIYMSVPHNVFIYIRAMPSATVTIVKDCPYWTFRRYTKKHKHMTAVVCLAAVKFDAVSDEFKVMPEFCCDKVGGSEFVEMNECLALILYEYDVEFPKLMLNIFYLDGEEGSRVWSKMYSVGPFNPVFGVLQGFYGGEIVFNDHGRFFCYDRITDTIYKLPSTTCAATNDCRLSCFRYTPSLAFIEGMKSDFYSSTRARRASVQYSRVPRRLINALRY